MIFIQRCRVCDRKIENYYGVKDYHIFCCGLRMLVEHDNETDIETFLRSIMNRRPIHLDIEEKKNPFYGGFVDSTKQFRQGFLLYYRLRYIPQNGIERGW